MIRRKFLRMLGLAPAAAIVAPSIALPMINIHQDYKIVNGKVITGMDELIRATIRNRRTGLITLITRQNALLTHLKSVGTINREPLPMWRLGVE